MRIVGDDRDDDFDDDDEVAFDEDDDPTVACPHCHRDVYDDAEQCPRCGAYLSHEDRPWVRKPAWVVVGVCICLAIVYRWIFFVDLK